MEVGDVYRRNNDSRGVPVYYAVVISIGEKYINIRRELFNSPLVHENVIWLVEDFLRYFEKT